MGLPLHYKTILGVMVVHSRPSEYQTDLSTVLKYNVLFQHFSVGILSTSYIVLNTLLRTVCKNNLYQTRSN